MKVKINIPIHLIDVQNNQGLILVEPGIYELIKVYSNSLGGDFLVIKNTNGGATEFFWKHLSGEEVLFDFRDDNNDLVDTGEDE